MIENSKKIKGKTYSLFGDFDSSDWFYKFISDIIDVLVVKYESEVKLLEVLQSASKKQKNYKKFVEENNILIDSESLFKNYVYNVEENIKEQSILKFWKSDLKLH